MSELPECLTKLLLVKTTVKNFGAYQMAVSDCYNALRKNGWKSPKEVIKEFIPLVRRKDRSKLYKRLGIVPETWQGNGDDLCVNRPEKSVHKNPVGQDTQEDDGGRK